MRRRKKWTQNQWSLAEEHELVKNYKTSTIKELLKMFPKRSEDSINAKIKRLKIERKIEGSKDVNAVDRAMKQRRKLL